MKQMIKHEEFNSLYLREIQIRPRTRLDLKKMFLVLNKNSIDCLYPAQDYILHH